MDVTLKVGKEGIDKVVAQADNQLKRLKEIKVKVNHPPEGVRMKESTRKVAENLAQKTESNVVWVKGRTFVLRRD